MHAAPSDDEQRQAEDGCYYTRAEFLAFYGEDDFSHKWHMAKRLRTVAADHATADQVLHFHSGGGRLSVASGNGTMLHLTHAEVLGMDDPFIEHNHDFIQWLFPTDKPSASRPGAPVLSASAISGIPAESILSALARM